jgi:hypothetical protein
MKVQIWIAQMSRQIQMLISKGDEMHVDEVEGPTTQGVRREEKVVKSETFMNGKYLGLIKCFFDIYVYRN